MPLFITLPSDSSMKYWPGNTAARFRVRLPRPIDFDLDKQYEVALCQFQYLHAYDNVPDRICDFEISRFSDAQDARIRPPMVVAASTNANAIEPMELGTPPPTGTDPPTPTTTPIPTTPSPTNTTADTAGTEATDTSPDDPLSVYSYSTYFYGKLKSGHYKNATDLIAGLNLAIMEALRTEYDDPWGTVRNDPLTGMPVVNKVRKNLDDDCAVFIRPEMFVYDEVTNKVRCEADNLQLIQRYTDHPKANIDLYAFNFHPEMLLRLGYTRKIPESYTIGDHERSQGSYARGRNKLMNYRVYPGQVGESTVDHNLGFHNIYIYTDAMKESNSVGETLQPCLRVVPVTDEERHLMVYYEPQNLHFFPLRSNYIRDVEVVLRTDTGDLVPFTRGSSVITLVVRRASPLDLEE